MKIKTKIISAFLTAFIAIFIATSVAVGIFTTISMTNEVYKVVNTASISKAEHIRTYLNSQKEVIVMLGASTVFRDLLLESTDSADFDTERQRVSDRLDRTILADKNINELFLVDKNGKVVVSTNKEHEGSDKSADLFFTEGNKGVFIKDVYISDVTQNLAWGLAAPITNDKTEEFLGAVVARININPLFQILKTNSYLGKTGESFLVNKDKYFLTPSLFLGNDVVLKKKIDTENVRNCFDPKEIEELVKTNDYISLHQQDDHDVTKIYRDYRNVNILSTHAYIPETNWCLITKVDMMEIFRPIIQIVLIFILSCIFGVIIFLIVGSQISKKITQPIEELQKGVEIIQKGNLDHKVEVDSKDEIGDLSRGFDKMTWAIKQSRVDVDRKVEEQTKEIVQKSKDVENQQKAMISMLEDVSFEKEKYKKQVFETTKFQMTVEFSQEHMIITDIEGIVLYANTAAENLTGFSKKEMLGNKCNLWGKQMDSVFYQKLWKTIKYDKKPFSGEITNKRKDGIKYIASAIIFPILSENNEVIYFAGIERDISKEKEVDRMKTEFISLASHQLRTPLSAMKWFGEMLLAGDAGPLNKEQNEFISNIYQSNERMISLVNSLLNISRIESGRIIIDPRPTDLGQLINEILVELHNKLQEKNQKLIISVHSELPKINIDPKLISEVYKNLLTNAIKYSPKDSEISVFVSRKEKDLISQVSDNGYGIPQKDIDKVFQKFYRGENIIKLETEGTGLGLYLVKAVVESSGGKIWFKSTEHKGTTFWFSLPVKGSIAKSGEVTLDSSH